MHKMIRHVFKPHSYNLHGLRTHSNQSELTILKICSSSAHAFLFSGTPNNSTFAHVSQGSILLPGGPVDYWGIYKVYSEKPVDFCKDLWITSLAGPCVLGMKTCKISPCEC